MMARAVFAAEVAGVLAQARTPLLIAGGAVFGWAYGSVYNCLGMLLAATTSYLLASALGRDFVVHVTRGHIRRAEAVFDRHGFCLQRGQVELRFGDRVRILRLKQGSGRISIDGLLTPWTDDGD